MFLADDYEETDDDESDEEILSGCSTTETGPGTSKMVFNPLAALLRVPEKARERKTYTKPQLNRFFLQRMGRRSRRW